MKLNKILGQLKTILPLLKKFRYPLIGTLIITAFAFTVYQIDYLSVSQRDEKVYNELLSKIEVIKFDQGTIDTILQLKEAGVDVKPQFPSNRNNPF